MQGLRKDALENQRHLQEVRESQNSCRGGRKRRASKANGPELVLRIPATAEVVDSRWGELTLAEKVRALNSLHDLVS